MQIQIGGPLPGIPGVAARCMAFGSLTLRIVDPGLFSSSIGQANPEELGRWLAPKVLALIHSCAMEWIAGGHFNEQTIGQAGPAMAQTLAPHLTFLPQYGLQLVSFDSLTINAR